MFLATVQFRQFICLCSQLKENRNRGDACKHAMDENNAEKISEAIFNLIPEGKHTAEATSWKVLGKVESVQSCALFFSNAFERTIPKLEPAQ